MSCAFLLIINCSIYLNRMLVDFKVFSKINVMPYQWVMKYSKESATEFRRVSTGSGDLGILASLSKATVAWLFLSCFKIVNCYFLVGKQKQTNQI